MSGPRRQAIRALLPLVLLAVVVVLVLVIPESRAFFSPDNLVRLLEKAGWWAPVAFALVMAVSIVISPIPNVPIAAVLGMAYGPLIGTIIALLGAIVGAMAAFSIARRFGNRAIRALTGKPVYFCNGCSERSLSVLVLVARLIPIVSFDVVSYGAGLSRMAFWRFVLWSFLGMIPWTWFYTKFGSAALGNPVLAAILGVGLAAAVFLLPSLVRRYNPFGLRRIMMGGDHDEDPANGPADE